MHAKAKARIDQKTENIEKSDKSDLSKTTLKSLVKKGPLLAEMKQMLVDLCDDALKSGLLSRVELAKVVSVRSKVIIEL